MVMSAAICGLNGAGSALGSPNGLSAAVRPDNAASTANAVTAATMAPAMVRPRMAFRLLICSGLTRNAPRCRSGELLDALQRAFGLDRDLRVGARRRSPDDAQLLVAWLVAGHLDVLGIDLFAEAGHLVSAEKVGARDDTAAILHRHGHLGVGNGGAVGVAHEAEIGRTFLLAVVVVVAEAGTSRPHGERNGAAHREDRARHPPATPNRRVHPGLPKCIPLHPRSTPRQFSG